MVVVRKQISLKDAKRIFSDVRGFESDKLAGYYRLIGAVYGQTDQIKAKSLSIANIERVLLSLDEESYNILQLRFWECYTLEQVGQVFCVTREAIRQKQCMALNNLERIKEEFVVGSHKNGKTVEGFSKLQERKEELKKLLEKGKGQKCNISIDVLKLSVRSYNALKRARITTIGQLISKTEKDLLKIRSLGVSCVEEIKKKLKMFLPQLELVPIKESLNILRLPEHIKHKLKSSKICTLEQFLKLSSEDLVTICGFGRKSIQTILYKQQEFISKQNNENIAR